ncbi:MAG: hypothetical protein EP340_07035 [Alphaproteobacteria bacterium]|nr:MAG: hypothetical protein EP340_07035 [Alphaproteobacteria bacterium]
MKWKPKNCCSLGRLIALGAFLGIAACSPEADGGKVVVTVRPLYGLTAALMEGVGTPHLLETSDDVHQAILRPSDARELASADLVIWLGPEFEPGLAKRIGSQSSLALSDQPGISFLPVRQKAGEAGELPATSESDHDPHIWLSVERMRLLLPLLAGRLAKQDPVHAALYESNHRALDARLAELQQNLSERVRQLPQGAYIVHHDAYQYFEKDFGLTPLAIIEGSEHLPVSARHLAEIYHLIEVGDPVCLIVENQPPGKLAQKIADEAGLHIVVADPLARALPLGPDLYQSALSGMATALESCLTP